MEETVTNNNEPVLQLERKKSITSPVDSESIDDETRINRESITLVWYDVELEETNYHFEDDVKQTKIMLRELNDFVQLFSNELDCIEYMEKFRNETIILIISGSGASSQLLQKAHTLRHVDTIFIFCIDVLHYMPLLDSSLKNTKIAGIFDEQENLKTNIVKTVRAIEKQAAIFAIYDAKKQKSNRNLTRDSGSFVWLQLTKAAVQRLSANMHNEKDLDLAKGEMLSKCREYYRGNVKEMKNIDEFERTYKPSDAISWYTRDSFVYKLINKALRTEDVQALYLYRYYIVDLCTCLAENYEILRDYYTLTPTLKLYRGMKQPREEVQRLQDSKEQLISTNAFFSASRNRKVAEAYAGAGSEQLVANDLESIIFEINVDFQSNKACFADVSFYSPFPDEEEILFDFATVFEIKSMLFDPTISSWICVMITTDKGNAIAKDYIELQTDQMNKGDVVILLGNILYDMGEFKKSKDYYQNLKDRLPADDPDVLFGLGRAHGGLNEFKEALPYFYRASNIYLSVEPSDLVNAAKAATYAGNTHRFLCEYDQALSCYTNALNLFERAEMTETLLAAKAFTGLGWLYYYLGKDQHSFQYFQQALSIVELVVSFQDHPDFSEAHMNVAQELYRHGDYDQAVRHIEITVNIARRIFPNKSYRIGTALLNMGKFLYKQGKYDEALSTNLEAVDIFVMLKNGKDRIEYAFAYNNIGKIYYRTKNYQAAKEHYDKALDCLKMLMPNGHIDIAYTLKNMSELYLAMKELEIATSYIHDARKFYF